MDYSSPYDTRYQIKKSYPMVVFFFVILTMFGLIYSPYLSAGDTMFKECKNCGHLNYQFSNTCSLCGESGRFEDVYLKPDCEKRDAKKKRAKAIEKCRTSRPSTHEEIIESLDRLIACLKKDSEKHPDDMRLTESIGALIFTRQSLIKQHDQEVNRH